MEITILGTGASIPTKERNVSGIFLSYKNDGILFDCGEGTQRQMNIAGIKRTKVNKIFITHWHADHTSGLIGLLQTLGNEIDPPKIELYGPKETKDRIDHLLAMTVYELRFELKVHEFDEKGIFKVDETEDYSIYASKMHHTTPCLAYSLIEKEKRKINMKKLERLKVPEGPHLQKLQEGKSIIYDGKKIDVDDVTSIKVPRKITVIMDTEYNPDAIEIARDSDLLIIEATFDATLMDKAKKFKHMTGQQAAQIASQADVKRLVLTHFSQRYKTLEKIEEEAKDVFSDTMMAFDLMKIKL